MNRLCGSGASRSTGWVYNRLDEMAGTETRRQGDRMLRSLSKDTLRRSRPCATWLGLLCAAVGSLSAQQQVQHAGEYSQADIQAGAGVYASQCTTCHGPNVD